MTSSLSLSNSIDLTPRLLSYNINSLGFYASDHNNRSRSARVHSTLRELLKTQDIICLQETNLHSEESCALSHFKTEGASVSLNNFSKGSAGTAIIDSYHVTRLYNPTDVLLPVICAGYAQMRLYTAAPESGRSSFAIINVYLKTGGHYEFNAKILQSLRAVKIDVPVFACGDFNFVNRAEDTSSSSWRSPPLAFLSVWQSFLSAFDLSEMLHDRHTFYHIAPDAFSWSSRLDRFLVPSSLLCHPLYSPSVDIPYHHTNRSTNEFKNMLAFSDHLPISLSFQSNAPETQHLYRIPNWITESASFASILRSLWNPSSVIHRPYVALAAFKKAISSAAKVARKCTITEDNPSLQLSQLLCLFQLCSRPNQDLPRIMSIFKRNPSARDLVEWNGNRWIPTGLRAAIDQLYLENPQSKKCFHPAKEIAKIIPSSRASISSLRARPDDPPADSASEKSKLCATFWGRVWEKRPTLDPKISSRFLQQYHKQIDPTLLQQLTLEDILYAIKNANDSTPGPDGIPFSAWKAAPDLAAPILLNAFNAMSKRHKAPDEFNHGLLFLLPKKLSGLIEDTRPLSVTNTDNRIIASAVANVIMPAVKKLVSPCQKGFLSGIDSDDHIVSINSYFYEAVAQRKTKFLFFLDTAKAFDSIGKPCFRFLSGECHERNNPACRPGHPLPPLDA